MDQLLIFVFIIVSCYFCIYFSINFTWTVGECPECGNRLFRYKDLTKHHIGYECTHCGYVK